MALTRPLRLKSEIAKSNSIGSSSDLPIARVWVDSGVFHLDGSFDYLIPDNLSPNVSIGSRVQVPFHGRELEALVIDRVKSSKEVGLKAISKVLSINSAATAESIELMAAVSTRWAAHPFDVVRSAIPPRVASVDKEIWIEPTPKKVKTKASRVYLHIPPVVNQYDFLASYITNRARSGSILIVVPDSRSVSRVVQRFPHALVLDSALERSTRYRNFLNSRYGESQIVIGTRGAIFAPLSDLEEIVILNEGSEHHYEIRSPGWNVRDVAILRSMKSKVNLTFVGYSPSAEIARLIESRWVTFVGSKSRVEVIAYSQTHGELIPSRLVTVIRNAMKSGPILFLSPRKGYSQAITCAKCRNIAKCQCGGKLVKRGAGSVLECSVCAQVHPEWKCSWCHASVPFLLSRGSERFAFEIGAAFPGSKVIQSTSEMLVDDFNDSSGLVIATPGSIPQCKKGYSLVVVLEAERFLMQADIRAQERIRELFFSTAAHVSSQGKVAVIVSEDNPIIGALASWKPSLVSQRELRERQEVMLPPFSRAVTLDIDNSESQSLSKGLIKAQADGRLPKETKFYGPSRLKDGVDRIVALTPLENGDSFIALLHEFQRRRSASKKTLASIRIDPYSLSR